MIGINLINNKVDNKNNKQTKKTIIFSNIVILFHNSQICNDYKLAKKVKVIIA